MGEGLTARVEVDHFFEWLHAFEQRVQGLGGGGCRYRSASLHTRVQYSWYHAAAAGRPAVCISDLQFTQASVGQAIVQAVANCFSYGQHVLEAQTLVVEHPGTASLRRWLSDSAFTPICAPGEASHTWYLNRQDTAPTATQNRHLGAALCLPTNYWNVGDPEGPAESTARATTGGDDGSKTWGERQHA